MSRLSVSMVTALKKMVAFVPSLSTFLNQNVNRRLKSRFHIRCHFNNKNFTMVKKLVFQRTSAVLNLNTYSSILYNLIKISLYISKCIKIIFSCTTNNCNFFIIDILLDALIIRSILDFVNLSWSQFLEVVGSTWINISLRTFISIFSYQLQTRQNLY